MMRRRCRAVLAAVTFCAAGTAASAAPTATFQCEKPGGNAAIVNACGARWEAANVDAHVASGNVGESNAACLQQYAALLRKLASGWATTKKFTPFTGPWPCGKRPTVGSDDDGVLASACPKGVWSYSNEGRPSCAHDAGQEAPSAHAARAEGGPSFEQTAQWINDNLTEIAHGTRSDGMTTEWHDFAVTKCSVEMARTESSAETKYATVFTIPFARVQGVTLLHAPSMTTSAGESVSAPVVVDVALAAPRLVHYVSDGPLGTGDTNELRLFAASDDGATRLANALRRLATLCRSANVF